MLKSANLVPNTTTKTAFVNIIATPANFKMIIYTFIPGLFTRRLNILFPILFVFMAIDKRETRFPPTLEVIFPQFTFLLTKIEVNFFLL